MNQRPTAAGTNKLWGGRFDQPPDELFYQFQRSFPFDRRLLPYELAVDRAWARAIEKVGILSSSETQQTLTTLDAIAKRAESDHSWLDLSPAEDVHHFVEIALVERLGSLGTSYTPGGVVMNWWPPTSVCSLKMPRKTSPEALLSSSLRL